MEQMSWTYLMRIERFATANKWEKSDWVVCLSALLTDRALEVYTRLSEAQAVDYERLKNALLLRNELTEEGYRSKFRNSVPDDDDETSAQFIVRLGNYLRRWIEMNVVQIGGISVMYSLKSNF